MTPPTAKAGRASTRHTRSAAPLRSGDKLLSLAAAQRWAQAARRRGERIVFTNGCFDLLHEGHLESLEAARRLGDRLVVAVNHDASVRRLKGPARPIQPARVRKRMVAALACVDRVIGFGADTPLRAILAIRPHVLAKGGDWRLEEIVGRAEVESWGGRVERLPRVPGVSTTGIIERLRG